jgi:hypothetical protein
MNTFPMTELVIDVLDAEDLTQGKAVAQKIVALAKDGNAKDDGSGRPYRQRSKRQRKRSTAPR